MPTAHPLKKQKFSSFTLPKAFKQLGVTQLQPWSIRAEAIVPSAFFQERLSRLQRVFDLRSYEESKKLLIDAICEEAILEFERLKVWKGAALESDTLTGNVDYLIAENKAYLEAPLVCIIEAKKDNFEQGLAQCLVEMQACQWQNRQLGHDIDVFGIVTNGDGWQFYKLTTAGQIYETLLYSLNDLPAILGALHFIFQICEQSLLK
ncbi:MAG: hypothetical protein ACP5RH_04740 [Leptodesmis sp.]|uniref:hypothetical protein n=1 Tax=Leptodesmis sp. TaxID=3100501 RepID=UPI003D0D2F82